jgi:Sensors of blue-light using FAD
MRQLLYVSHTDQDLPLAALDHILTASRANNAMLGITGLLLHIEGGFLQMLEGEERSVREVYARVAADRRHHNLRMLLDREHPQAFPGWDMAFERPSPDEPETAGMYGVAREAILGHLSPTAGKVVALMLQTFYRVQQSDAPVHLYYAG